MKRAGIFSRPFVLSRFAHRAQWGVTDPAPAAADIAADANTLPARMGIRPAGPMADHSMLTTL
jgi:hypothetical protein